MSIPSAEVTVRPLPQEPPLFGVRTPGDTDWPGIRTADLVGSLNPLHHIPFISSLYSEVSGDSAAPIARLVGGALLGGPLGFVAGLMSVIFEQETGKDVIGAVASVLSGEDGTQTTRLAAVPSPASTETIAAAPIAAAATVDYPAASAAAPTASDPRDQTILSLFGSGQASAHRSYKQAQLRPYLRDVTRSTLL